MSAQWPRTNIAEIVHTADVQGAQHLPQQGLLLGTTPHGTGQRPLKKRGALCQL